MVWSLYVAFVSKMITPELLSQGPSGDFSVHVQVFCNGSLEVGEGLHMVVGLPGHFDPHHRRGYARWRQAQDLSLSFSQRR